MTDRDIIRSAEAIRTVAESLALGAVLYSLVAPCDSEFSAPMWVCVFAAYGVLRKRPR